MPFIYILNMDKIRGTFMAVCKECGGQEERTNKWNRVVCINCKKVLLHQRYEKRKQNKAKNDLSTLEDTPN